MISIQNIKKAQIRKIKNVQKPKKPEFPTTTKLN